MFSLLRSQRGSMLIDMVVGSAMSALVYTASSAVLSNTMTMMNGLSGSMEKNELRMSMISLSDCAATLPLGICTPGNLIQVSKSVPGSPATVIVANTGVPSKFGKYSVRAECAPTGNGYFFRAVIMKDPGSLTSTNVADFLPEKTGGTPILWSDNESRLHPQGIVMCGSDDISRRLGEQEAAALDLRGSAGFPALCGANYFPFQPTIAAGKIEALEKTIADLTPCLDALEARVAAVETRRNDIRTRWSNLNNFASRITTNPCNGPPRKSVVGYEPDGTPRCGPVNGDVNGDGYPDLITGAMAGGGPRLQIFSGANLLGGPLVNFFTFDSAERFGTAVAMTDLNGDGFADFVAGAGPGGAPHYKWYLNDGAGNFGAEAGSEYAFESTFRGGVRLGP